MIVAVLVWLLPRGGSNLDPGPLQPTALAEPDRLRQDLPAKGGAALSRKLLAVLLHLDTGRLVAAGLRAERRRMTPATASRLQRSVDAPRPPKPPVRTLPSMRWISWMQTWRVPKATGGLSDPECRYDHANHPLN